MVGIFIVFIVIVLCIKESFANSYHDGQSRRKAIEDGWTYYLDWKGTPRRVDNGHKILIHVPYFEDGSWDTVDQDALTGEILRNYSQEKRDEEALKETKRLETNKKEKAEAIIKGMPYYSSYEYCPGTKTMRYFKRRVSDDLLLHKDTYQYAGKAIHDAKCRFILGRKEGEYKDDGYFTIEKDKEFNVYNYKHMLEYGAYNEYEGAFWNPTKEELDEYVKKIKPIGYEEFVQK